MFKSIKSNPFWIPVFIFSVGISLLIVMFFVHFFSKNVVPQKDTIQHRDSVLKNSDLIAHVFEEHFSIQNLKFKDLDSVFEYVFQIELRNQIDSVVVFDWNPERIHFYAAAYDSTFIYEFKNSKARKYHLNILF